MGEFIISKDGRLLEKLFDVLTSTDGVFPKQQFRDLHDTEFHGDLVFYGRVTSDGELTKYVARFTEGQLAWIRTLSTLPENLRQQILAKT